MSFIKDIFNVGSLYFIGGMLTKLIADSRGIKICSLKFFMMGLTVFVIIGTTNALFVG